MARPCAACSSPHEREIARRLRAGVTLTDTARWLRETSTPISRNALARHARDHLGTPPRRPGPRPVSDDFLEAVRDRVHERLETGELEPTIRDGIGAQKALDARLARNADRDLALRIAAILGGGSRAPSIRVIDPDWEAAEAEFRPLLTAGADATGPDGESATWHQRSADRVRGRTT